MKVVLRVLTQQCSRQELQDKIGLSARRSFNENYLQPALEAELIEMTIPSKPSSKNQKYQLTDKGKEVRKSIV